MNLMDSVKTGLVGLVVGAAAYHFYLKDKFGLPTISLAEMNKLQQENVAARDLINAMGQRIALAESPGVAERHRKYGAMPFQTNPNVTGRQRKFGFAGEDKEPNEIYGFSDANIRTPDDIMREKHFGSMPFVNQTVLERERKYGAMQRLGFAENTSTIANAFGMR